MFKSTSNRKKLNGKLLRSLNLELEQLNGKMSYVEKDCELG
jgi:hypothetical protein